VAGVERPGEWNGGPALAVIGGSITATFTDPGAAGHAGEVMMECEGHRGYRRGSWEAVARHRIRTPFGEDRWELFDVDADPTQVHDLAGAHPEVLAELRERWEQSAWDNQVFPLDEGTGYRFLIRPPWNEVFEEPVVLLPGETTLDRWRSQRLILWRDFEVTASVRLGTGDQGILVAHGDQGGGYALYVDDTGELVAAHNGYGLEGEVRGPVVPAGDHELGLSVTAPGGDIWDLALRIDGEEVARGEGFRLLMAMAPFEGIDVGLDRRSPVCWDVYRRHGAFPFTGELRHVRYEPGPAAPDAPTGLVDFLREWGRSFE
jgi:arylsulfatase